MGLAQRLKVVVVVPAANVLARLLAALRVARIGEDRPDVVNLNLFIGATL